jgi:hypothetical protein
MKSVRLGLVVALALGAGIGCTVGGPDRASDIQNLNGISDDISAVTMTQSDSLHTHDPNSHPTLPNHYEVSGD